MSSKDDILRKYGYKQKKSGVSGTASSGSYKQSSTANSILSKYGLGTSTPSAESTGRKNEDQAYRATDKANKFLNGYGLDKETRAERQTTARTRSGHGAQYAYEDQIENAEKRRSATEVQKDLDAAKSSLAAAKDKNRRTTSRPKGDNSRKQESKAAVQAAQDRVDSLETELNRSPEVAAARQRLGAIKTQQEEVSRRMSQLAGRSGYEEHRQYSQLSTQAANLATQRREAEKALKAAGGQLTREEKRSAAGSFAADVAGSFLNGGGNEAWSGIFGALAAADETIANAVGHGLAAITGDEKWKTPNRSEMRDLAEYHAQEARTATEQAKAGRGRLGQIVMGAAEGGGNMVFASSLGALGAGSGLGAGFGFAETTLGPGATAAQKAAARLANLGARVGNEILSSPTNALISAGAVGHQYLDASERGATQQQALANAIGAGLLEYFSNKLFAGTPMEDKPGEKGYVTQLTEYVAKKLGKDEALGKILSTTGGKAASWVLDKIGEGIEEVVTGFGDPIIEKITWNKKADMATLDELAEEFIGGIALAFFMLPGEVVRNAAAETHNRLEVNKLGAQVKKNGGYQALLDSALKGADTTTEAYQIASKLREGVLDATPANIGDLAVAYNAAWRRGEVDPARLLEGLAGTQIDNDTQYGYSSGLPLKAAEQISSVVQKVRAGEELTADDVRSLNLTQKRNREVFNALTGLNIGDDVNRLISGKKDYKAVATLIGNRVAAIREAQAQQDAQEAEAAVEVAREAGRRAAEKPAAVDTQAEQTYNEGEPVVYVNGEAKTFDQFTEHVRAMDGGEAVTPQEMREMFDGIFEEQRRTLNERREAEQTRGTDAAAPAELSGRADERSGGERGGVSGRTGNAEAESRRGQTGVHPGRGSTSGESNEGRRRAYLAASEKEGTELSEASIQVRKDQDGRIIMREIKADTFAKTATYKALARKYEAVGAPLRGMLGNYKGMANGVSRLGKESIVRLDDPQYSGTQLGDHELGHQVFFLDSTRFDEAKTAVLSQLSAKDIDGLLKKYHLQFCKAYLTPAQITAYDEGWLPEHLRDQYEDKLIEEMLCDAYGSMDRGGAEMSKFHDAVASVIDDAIGLDADMWEELEPLNGDEVYSVKSMLNAAGFTVKPASEETGWLVQAFDADGNRVTTVTEEHIKHSGIGALIQSAVDHKTISKADAKEQREAAADLVNMMLKTQTPEMVWKFAGSALFSAVKSNSDGQYGTTIDFSTVCRKTQEMVTAMSEAMTRLGRGLTRDEIIDLQKDILEEGGTVNCPVCYVFSRWAGVGGILGNMKKFQDKYGHEWDDPAKLQSRIDELTRATATKKTLREVLLQNDVDYQEYAARKEALQAQKRENNAKLRQLKKGGKKAVAANAAAIEELQKSNRTIDAKINAASRSLKEIEDSGTPELAWLKRVRQAEDYWEHGYVKEDSILFDLNTADAFAEKYPLAWGYRTSRGPAAGKAILPYSDMRLGDLINGPKGSGAEFGESVEVGNGETQRVVRGGEFDKKQQSALEAAIQKMKAQNLIGGQRFQSTSDFRYDYGLDYLQAFWELQAIGGKMQTYTKIIEFVDLVAAIGGDVNMSVMPLEKGYKTIDGVDVLQYSNVTGIDPEAAIRANRMYDNAQLILVGINDRHIMAALEDSEATGGINVGFVIPYHASGASINQFIRGLVENLGETFNESYYRDYSKVQNDSARKNATAEQKHRAELRELLLRGSYSVETGEVTETGKKKTKTVEWTPTEEDIAFLRGKSKDISGYTFEELRDIEKRALAGDKDAIAEYESWSAGVLWDVYQKMWVDESREDTYGVRLNSDQAEHIMPHEYWNKTVDRSKAYVNGFIFRSYCYSLGLTPRFTGIQSDGRRATAVVDGEKVNYGDFSDSTGYWKTLIDRPMYANDGKYRDQTPVNVTDISKEMLTPKYGEERWGEYKVREPSDQLAKRAADRFVERAQARAEEGEKFSVSQEQTDSFVDWYRKFYEARKQRGGWSGHEVEEFFRDNPDYDFVQRFFDGDKSARKELQEMVQQIDDVAVLEGLSWYSTQSHWTPANEYRSAVTKVRNIYKKRIEELQAERVGGEEIKLEHRQYSVQEARSIFDQLNGNEDLTKLADKVFTVAEKLGVEIYATNKLLGGNMGNRAGASAGRYVWLKQNYFADKRYTNQQKAGTILHELIHSATVYAMDPSAGYSRYISSDPKLVDAVDQLRSIYRQVRADPDFKGEYGITNELEFVAELSNERFREKLAKKNLLQKVIDAIRTLFGIETDTALSGASAALDYLLDHADYTQAGYHNWDVALQAEREMSHRGKTLYMETPTQSAKQVEKENVRYSTSVNMGTLLSGGGLVDHALRSVTESVMAVELDDKAAAVFQMNNGDVTVDDVVKFVRDGKLDDLLKRQSIDYLHVSPVCKNYSRMNIRRSTKSDSNVDMETAKAIAEAIEKIRSKVFTLEQVPGYEGSAALKQITDTLGRLGYKWNGVVANAYDYGGATSRDRYLLRAVRDGELPAAPKKTKGVSWYAATADLIDGLPVREDGLTPFMQARIDNTPALAKAIREAKGPILILQGTAGRQVRWVAADKPCPSITTDMHDARVLLPDGTVKTADARFFARIMGLPDSYQLPQYRGKDNQKQAYKVIGNGVPVQLTQKFFGNLLHDTLDTGVRFSVAEPEGLSAFQKRNIEFNRNAKEVGEPLKTVAGSPIKRFGWTKKNPNGGVGKQLSYFNKETGEHGSQIYLHKNYATDVVPADIYDRAVELLRKKYPNFEWNTIMYLHTNEKDVVRFDEAPDFDTAREPVPGNMVSVNVSTGTVEKSSKPNNQIWHHKWLWVKNDYDGFDVKEAWDWSKLWLSVIRDTKNKGELINDTKVRVDNRGKANGMGHGTELWNEQLRYFGLPIDGESVDYDSQTRADKFVSNLKATQQERADAPQTDTSEDTSLNQVPASMTNFTFRPTDRVLDWGGGRYDAARLFMQDAYPGLKMFVYDPFNRTKSYNEEVLKQFDGNPATVVTVNNVLNVINSERSQREVVSESKKYLAPDGVAIFTIYEGDRSGIGEVTKEIKDDAGTEISTSSWQNNLEAAEYVPMIEDYYKYVTRVGNFILASDDQQALAEAKKRRASTDRKKELTTASKPFIAQKYDMKTTEHFDADAVGEVKFSVTPKQDAEYLDAVKQGHMDTARWLVGNAANAAGYKLAVYHGTGEAFTVFRRGKEGIHLGTKDVAEQVAKNSYEWRSKKTAYRWNDIKDRVSEMGEATRRELVEQLGHRSDTRFTGDISDAKAVSDFANAAVEKEAKRLRHPGYNPKFDLPTFDRKTGEIVMPLYAKINRPFIVNGDILEWSPRNIAEMLLMRADGKTEYELGPDNMVDIRGSKVSLSDSARRALRAVSREDITGDAAWDALSKILSDAGYDGIRYRNEYEGDGKSVSYIALNQSDVKSADPVTYDDNGEVIPLSSRFDQSQIDTRFSISPEIQKWMELQKQYDAENGDGAVAADYDTDAKRQRAAERAVQRQVERAESEQARETLDEVKKDPDLAWKIYTKQKVRAEQQRSRERLNATRAAAREAVSRTKEIERAVADNRVLLEQMFAGRKQATQKRRYEQKLSEADQRLLLERMSKGHKIVDMQNDFDRRMERAQKQAEKRLGLANNRYEAQKEKNRSQKRMQRQRAQNILRDSHAAAVKRAAIETEQGPIKVLRQNPEDRSFQQKVSDAANALRTKHRAALRNFVANGYDIEVFSRRQVGGTRADTLMTIYGGSSSTIERIYTDGLVSRAGDRIGDSLSDVVLCKTSRGKVDQNKQQILHEYMLLRHTVDRMSIESRAESALVAFEEEHPFITGLDPKNLAELASLTDNEAAKLENPEFRDLARQYGRLLRAYNEAQNKPVLGDVNGNPVTAETAQRLADEILAENPWLEEKAQGIYDWWDTFMREWVVGDTLSQEEYDTMREMYPHYVPTYRVKDAMSSSSGFVGMGNASVSDIVKRAKGSTEEIVNIEDSFANLVRKAVGVARRNALYANMIDSAMLDADASTFGDMMVFDWDSISSGEELHDLLRIELQDHVEDATKTALEDLGNGRYKVSAWFNGEKYSAFVSEEMFKSIKNVTGTEEEKWKAFTKIGNTITTPMKTAITGINPAFALRNILRDLPTAGINSISGLAFGKYWLRAMKEIASNSEHWQQFQSLGGTNATYQNDTKKGFAQSAYQKPGVKKAADWTFEKIGFFNEVTESMTRFAEYLATIDKLGDTYENRLLGIKNAAEVTVDFSRHGAYGTAINAWVPYWNPAVQGIDKVWRSVFTAPENESRVKHALSTLGRAAFIELLPEVFFYALLKGMLNGGDDDKYKDWEQLSDRTKDTYYCIPIPSEKKFFKIPKNREWGAILGTPLMRMLEAANGRSDPFRNYVTTSLEPNFLPGAIARWTPDGFQTDVIVFSQMMDLAKNKDFAGRTIVPYALQQGTKAGQYDDETSKLAKLLGEQLNFSPMQIDYLIKDYLGDFYSTLILGGANLQPQEAVQDTWKGLKKSWVADVRYSNQITSDYYETISELGKIVADKKNHGVGEEYKESIEYKTKSAMDKLYGEQISEISKQIREMDDGPEKDAAKEQIMGLAAEAMQFYKDSMAGEYTDPVLTAEYANLPGGVADELIRMKGMSKDYSFAPSTYSPSKYNDPKRSNREYILDDTQKAKYKEIYAEVYGQIMQETIGKSKYKSGSDIKKAELLEAARENVTEETRERFLKWLAQNYTSTKKSK